MNRYCVIVDGPPIDLGVITFPSVSPQEHWGGRNGGGGQLERTGDSAEPCCSIKDAFRQVIKIIACPK